LTGHLTGEADGTGAAARRYESEQCARGSERYCMQISILLKNAHEASSNNKLDGSNHVKNKIQIKRKEQGDVSFQFSSQRQTYGNVKRQSH
jgi:hypothetical protein